MITYKYFVFFALLHLSENCVTPSNEPGQCVALERCERIYNITKYEPRPLSTEIRELLTKSVCDGDARTVCCNLKDISTDITNHPNLKLLDQENCGISGVKVPGPGPIADLYEFPWMALIGYDEFWWCAGSLINQRYVIAAAHCAYGHANISLVRLGDYNVLESEDCKIQSDVYHCAPPAQDFQVESIIVHPLFTRRRRIYDIGLIRLNRNADFSKASVSPICLPTTERLINLELPYYTGTTYDCSEKSNREFDIIYKSKLKFIDLNECKEFLKKNGSNFNTIWPEDEGALNRICVQYEGSDCEIFGSGIIQFAISFDNYKTKYVIFGIDGFGFKRSKDGPEVYTKVSSYMHWILDTIKP